MGSSSLANVDSARFWAHRAWPEFERRREQEPIAILPIYGFADHGLGLPLDIEERFGGELLKQGLRGCVDADRFVVLPPWRFGLAPYPSCFFGIDPETGHGALAELAAGVRVAGVRQLVFFVAGPWNLEWIQTAAVDLRASTGMRTYVLSLARLGFDFHPTSATRGEIVAAAQTWLGLKAEVPQRKGELSDIQFRPGNLRQPAPLGLPIVGHHPELFSQSIARIGRILAEIAGPRKQEGSSADASPSVLPESAKLEPSRAETRRLMGLTRDRLDLISDRSSAWVIVPVGAIEQHGPHLPVGVDAILAEAWLSAACEKLPYSCPVWLAPPLTYGKSNEHAGFPGTLSVSAKTLRRGLLQAAEQVKALGFSQIAFFNTHGGNSAVLIYTVREIQTSLGMRAGLLNRSYRPTLSPQESAFGFHAGEWETSLMLAIDERLVAMDKAATEYPARVDDPGELRPEQSAATFAWLTRDVSTSGVMGDATAATKEKGLHWLDAGSTALAERILQLLASL